MRVLVVAGLSRGSWAVRETHGGAAASARTPECLQFWVTEGTRLLKHP